MRRAAFSRRAIILDRDGVINCDSDEFIKSPDEWIPIPGSLEAVARLHRAGHPVIVATNQSGVSRGLLTLSMLERIHARMTDEVRGAGGDLAGVFFCPHCDEDGCACRKPAPGLFYDIASRLGVDLATSYAVGDSERDIVAARRAGARPILVRTGKGLRTLQISGELPDVPVYENLAAFVDALLSTGIDADETR